MYKEKITKLKNFGFLVFFTSLFFPHTASAAGFSDVLLSILYVLDASIGVIIGLAAVIFVWGLITFVGSTGDAKKRSEANCRMVFGIIVLTVMVGIWGLVNLLVYNFDLDGQTVVVPVTEVGEIGGSTGGTIGTDPGSGGLVPCGTSTTDPCTACDLYKLINKLINFLMYISVPLAVLSISVGGGFVLFGAGFSEGLVSKGKGFMWDAIIGLIIILTAWLVINTVILQLTNPGVLVGPWSAVIC